MGGLSGSVEGYPAFLLPTQKFEDCDWECVEKYREEIRAGNRIGGLAMWAEGFLSALIDGHHRATAALVEGVPLTCLTIMTMTRIEREDNEKVLVLGDLLQGSVGVPFSMLPKDGVRILEMQPERTYGPKVKPIKPPGGESEKTHRLDPRWQDLCGAAAKFPDVKAVAALELVRDISDERIEQLLSSGGYGSTELKLVLRKLIASMDPRATQVAIRVANGHWPELWREVFQFLSTIRTRMVDQFFVDFLIRDEGEDPRLKEIADEYLKSDSGLD